MPYLRQSTSQTIRFGPCLDAGDGVTEETALTLAQADMRLSKDGGAFAQKNAAGNATHDSDGWYSTTLDDTDTNTVGELLLNVHQPANMLPVWQRWYVLETDIYDALFANLASGFDANQRVDVGAVLGTAQTAGDIIGDTNDIQARLPAALVSGRMNSNVAAINDNTNAATRLALSAAQVIPGTVDTAGFTPTATEFEADDITEATADHFNGRIVVWTSGALAGQATDITDYSLTGGRGHFTVTSMTEAAANNDTFVIV